MSIPGPTSHSYISQRLRLHYVDWGNAGAPPLILQHGGRDHCRSWDWIAQELRHDWHVICPDFRGHGDSAWSPDGDYSISALTYDFAQLVHSLGYDQVTIMAHSMGGFVTTRYAGLYPEKVAKFINIEGLGLSAAFAAAREAMPVAERLRDWIDQRRAAAGRVPRRYPTIEAAYQRMKEENTYLTDEHALDLTIHAASRNEDGTFSWKFDPYLHTWAPVDLPLAQVEELWRAVTSPTLVFHGADSFMTNPASDGRLAHLPNARLIEYERAGHWLHHDQFDRFMRDVRAFLAE